jgi:hypothetical protein
MNLYPDNYDVTVTIAFTDLNGAPITPSAVKAVLSDGDDQVVNDFGAITFDPAEAGVEITIPAEFNQLGAGELSDARILRVTLETAAGEIRRSSSYIIQGERRLEIMTNSFVSIESAAIIARDIPGLSGWSSASDDERYAALISAYHRLTRIPMKFYPEAEGPIETRENWGYGNDHNAEPFKRPYHWTKDLVGSYGRAETIIPASAWPVVTETEFMGWPAHFRKAVRFAQVAEAGELLEDDVVTRKHRQGIISETVGESSVMLRGGRLDLGISRRALEYLTGYVYYNWRVSRA